MGGGIDK
ncbi:hypothetical protein CGLO_18047 [Colletotrichum gloeosporioides Cg-14]|nr:hypothetical protein CGLO_18047 [Colletotrichum gloeosporioides Cg-14]